MSITGRIILKRMLVNYDVKEWTGVKERIRGRAFTITKHVIH
jgi:hypothetical protein